MTEIWKPIAGYEGRYEVSNLGRVKSLPFKQRYLLRNGVPAWRVTRERILAQNRNNKGYHLVHLYLDGERKALLVHLLVARAFLEGGGETVNHDDGDKANNRAGNLEWMSWSANHKHAYATGLRRHWTAA